MKKKPVKNIKLQIENGELKLLWDQNDLQWGVCCFSNEKEILRILEGQGVIVEDCSSFCKVKETSLSIDYSKKRCPLNEDGKNFDQEGPSHI